MDNFLGPHQDILGSDGIGDIPHPIFGGSNTDRYPLMETWTAPLPIALIGITPSSTILQIGESSTITIYINTLRKIESWNITQLHFTPGTISVTDIQPGNYWDPPAFFDPGIIDDANGTISNITAHTPETYPEENHTVCTLHITIVNGGLCTLEIDQVELLDPEGTPFIVIPLSSSIHILSPTTIIQQYPPNESLQVERPPRELNATIEDLDGDPLDMYIRWKNHDDTWVTLASYNDVGNGTYSFLPSGNDWIWGNTTYTWAVHVTDGTFWTNETYTFTTKGNRYDVNNDGRVNFIDAGKVWVHRTTNAIYDGLYDVNGDDDVTFVDAGLTWVNRD